MQGLKKILFWVFLGLALGAGVYGYFQLKNNKKPNALALSVLPDGCVVYFNTSNFFELNKKINSQSLVTDKLKLFGDINSFCGTLQLFDSLFASHEDLSEEIKNNLLHFAWYSNVNSWLVSFNIKQLGKEEHVTEALVKLLKASQTEPGLYRFIPGQGGPFYFKLNEGIVCVSGNTGLIQQAFSKSEQKLENNKAFIAFKNTLAENSLFNVYVDHSLYSKSKAQSRINLSGICTKGYSAGAIDFQPSQVKINGYVSPDSSELISLLQLEEPQSSEDVVDLLPFNVSLFRAYGFENFSALKNKLNSTELNRLFWDETNDEALFNAEQDFYGNLKSHLVYYETSQKSSPVVFAAVSEIIKTYDHLKFMSDSLMMEDSVIVYRMKTQGTQLFDPFYTTVTNYASFYQGHIFFSESSAALGRAINNLQKELVLNTNESFNSYKNQNFLDEFNYMVYASPNLVKDKIASVFNFKTDAKEDPFENFKHASLSLSANKTNFKFRLQLMNESEGKTKEQNILWTLNLDSTSRMSAFGFVNHITGENEIVVQDDANTLYLINAKGTVLWKKKLNEKITSAIYTVDIYKKNKFQLLFNSKNYLHLIDRNGNYVEEYPVKLPAEATSEMSLFDYDNDKDYRIFIACKNNSIYNYSIHGIKQDKFTTVRTENEVHLPIQYVKVGQSDYLVALDKEGKIYTFSRKGVGRIGLRNRTVAACQRFYVDAGNSVNNTQLVYVDEKSALINKISFADKKEILKLHSEIEHAAVSFDLVDDNRSMDLVLTNNNTVMAYTFSGDLILEKTHTLPFSSSDFYSDESHSVFYSLSEEQHELLVTDQIKGNSRVLPASALPLTSNLFKDNKKYLIITNGKQLNCVLLN